MTNALNNARNNATNRPPLGGSKSQLKEESAKMEWRALVYYDRRLVKFCHFTKLFCIYATTCLNTEKWGCLIKPSG